jgi:hypothetical protein
VGKWVSNKRGCTDADGRCYDPYNDDHLSPGDHFSGAATPLFRFGEGLSYTSFAIGGFSVAAQPGNAAVPAVATVTVTNTGAVAGAEVVQLYVEDPVMEFVRPWKRLLAFARVELAPEEAVTLTLPLTADELAFHDDDMVLRVVPGEYKVSVGDSSTGATYSPVVLTL